MKEKIVVPVKESLSSSSNGSSEPVELTEETIIFNFEEFLTEHEENLPEGLDPQYLAYVELIQNPFKNIRQVPKAILRLPMNAFLHQPWGTIYRLMAVIFVLSLPGLFILVQTSTLIAADGSASIGFIVSFLIIIGVLSSPAYLKLLYGILNTMVEGKSNKWLIDSIEKPFNEAYQTQWNRRLFIYCFVGMFLPDFQFIWYNLIKDGYTIGLIGLIFWFLALMVGHIGFTFMLYLSILSYRFVFSNTRIYDVLLIKIIDRVKGYTEGHESILSKKNYEVVGVLSDTPGLSIRSLGNIPIAGLVGSTLIFNSILFILLGPWLMATSSTLPSFVQVGDPTGLTFILAISLFISLIAAFGAVIMPIIRVSRVIGKFKHKALTELDPYLFGEITGVALNRDSTISNETHVLYMLRNYIYSMKPAPVNYLRLIQIALLLIIYVLRIVPTISPIL